MAVKNLNGSSVSFKQDELISFVESTHTYTVTGLGALTPVSTVIGKFFEPFNAEYWSLRKCWGNEVEAEKMREQWEANGAQASQAGTFMHATIENYLNGIEPAELTCNVTYHGKHVSMDKVVDISREWSFFKKFDQETRYTPFRTEWRIYDPEKLVAGTIDLLCSCDDGTYEIYDWKRSNKINPGEENRWSSGINGLEHLTDTAYTHYCLQQNLYRHIVEKNYGLKISRMNLVVLHPDCGGYKIIPIPRMQREVDIIMNSL
ncbi:MAG: hypothetical protein KBT13_08025 [Bacteroidales bacterium]|nr:hypothetical protein [Candidatus Sodaliphilus limicaballi]